MPGCGETGRPPLRSGTGQDARQSARPAGPSSDLPLVTRFAISLADKAALSALALGRPRLGLPRSQPLHNRHYVEPVTGFSVNDHEPAAPVRPLAGGSPRRTPSKERAASSARRTATPTVSRLGAQAAAAARLPRLRSKPGDSVLRSDVEGLQPAGARFRPGDARESLCRSVLQAVSAHDLPAHALKRLSVVWNTAPNAKTPATIVK